MPQRPRATAKKATARRATAKKASAKKTTAKKATGPLAFVQDPGQLVAQFPGLGVAPTGAPQPTHVVRILRPDDLVVLVVRCFGLDVSKVEGKVVLAPTSPNPYLLVGYPFQHIGEQAFSTADGENPFVPVHALVAEPSRLAYSVPAGTVIEYSVQGILDALTRLPLRVVPLATPRPFDRYQLGGLQPVHILPGGLALARSDAGIVLTQLAGRAARAPVRPAVHTLIADATAIRAARSIVAQQGALDLTGLTGGPALAGTRRPTTAAAGITRTGLGEVVARPIGPIRPTRQKPRAPHDDETSIEAPWRLIISPSGQGAFTHAVMPAAADTDPRRVELWHSRLGVRQVAADGTVSVDETSTAQRVVRGVWARDKDGTEPTTQDQLPFRMSMSGLDRVMVVRQSADPTITTPTPVDVTRLYLSSQGAWLDLHGKWDVDPYTERSLPTLESWDHIAPMGRDQYVKLVYPGYLFPFGHRCSLVKLTERRIDAGGTPIAALYQRYFLIVREPVRSYDDRTMPFSQVRLRPLVTPDIRDPSTQGTPNAVQQDQLFWPTIGSSKFAFTLDCLDRDGRRVLMTAPLLFVGSEMGASQATRNLVRNTYITPEPGEPAPRAIPASAQSVAVAPSEKPGDTAFETDALRFTGDPGLPGDLHSTPHLTGATVVVPAMKHLAPQAPAVDVHLAQPYLDHGFAADNATAQVFLELDTMTPMSFGQSAGGSTDRSGGFLQPDIPVRGLSRALGTVGQVGSLVDPPAGKHPFEPLDFLDGVLPKLFGLFSLVDILRGVGLDKAPAFVTEQLGEIAGLLADLQSLQDVLANGLGQLGQDAANAATTPLRQAAATARTALQDVRDDFVPPFTALTDAVSAFAGSGDVDAFNAAAQPALNSLAGVVTTLTGQLTALSLPPVLKAQLERLVTALAPLAVLAGQAAKILEQIAKIVDFVKGLDPENVSLKASFTWQPALQNFPADRGADDALFYVPEDGLLLSIEARASGKDGVGVDVLAELRNFGLNLFMDATLIKIAIDRLSFRSTDGRKPEVDVVMNGMAWQGVMSFIETLEELIPSDGFADPPYVDVDASGVKAGFDLALPNVAVGVFSLENISLGADVSVPFLGDAVTVGFHFCTREKPFRLTVLCVGGGGFVGLRISPKGIVLLEMSLEACAQLAIDLGVASGSVSIAVGIYLKLEDTDGSLTGYFRVRGEVDVLGLISASITLELSLTYEFASGKLVGKASIEVEVEVLFFSFSVSVSCERRLAGSNGDPTFAQQLGIAADGTVPDPGAPDGGVPAWTDYCAAFAGV